MKLRHYQQRAVDEFFQWFNDGKGRPLIVLPTGTGKSIVAAEICRRMIQEYPHTRILVATHVKELVQQNYEKMLAIWPSAPAGIVSAGLGKKDYQAQIMFGGIQSLYRRFAEIGHVDLMLVDEAHAIPRKGQGMWRSFEEAMMKINPNFCVGGMTATDYRMTTGSLTKGQDPQFDGVCYEYSIIDALDEGYLSPIVTPPEPLETELPIDGIKKIAGDFAKGELERAVNVDELTKACCDEIIKNGQDRKSWLIFASGNAHAQSIHEYLESTGLHGYVVTQSTTKEERAKATSELVSGTCQYLVNNMILTTGFDCPRLDLIACVRPTQSPGLWVQMCGRGVRLHPDKENCLLLDFGGNIDRHGPIDKIEGIEWYEKEKGDAPLKICPQCDELLATSVKQCHHCSYEFPEGELDINPDFSRGALFSFDEAGQKELAVIDRKMSRHKGKNGKPDTLRVQYYTFDGEYSEFICYDHAAGTKAYIFAQDWFGGPLNVQEAIEHQDHIPIPSHIVVVKEKKYFKVLQRLFK